MSGTGYVGDRNSERVLGRDRPPATATLGAGAEPRLPASSGYADVADITCVT